jgi:hypothetical protein
MAARMIMNHAAHDNPGQQSSESNIQDYEFRCKDSEPTTALNSPVT